MDSAEVFPYLSYPKHTYVEREQSKLEAELRDTFRQTGAIASISGPSKTGKSMLVERVVRQAEFITHRSKVHSSEIGSVEDVWEQAIYNLGRPTSTEKHQSEIDRKEGSAKGGVDIGVEFGGEVRHTTGETNTTVEVDDRTDLNKLCEIVDPKSYVLLIEDFHNLDTELQKEVARGIKGASERNLSVCVTLISYQTENLEKVYPDLASRVHNIEIDSWEKSELEEIANIGFNKLNIDIASDLVNKFIKESGGSPQLMQLLCYSACRNNHIYETADNEKKIGYDEDSFVDIFRKAISTAGYKSVVQKIDEGAQTRGTDRRVYLLQDNPEIISGDSEGDYYRCCLRAIAADPPEFTFHRDVLYQRVKDQCVKDRPQKNQVSKFCEKMEDIVNKARPDSSLVNWDEEEDILHISEPGLLFNIRWSIRIGLNDDS